MSTKAPSLIAFQRDNRFSLFANLDRMFVGNAIYAGSEFFTLVLLAKLVQPEMVGQYALGLALVYPAMLCINLQSKAIINSDPSNRLHFGYYLGLRLLMTALALVAVYGVTQILRYDRDLTSVVLMVGVAYGIESISDVYYARLEPGDRTAEISKSLMARALLSALALMIAVYVSHKVVWGIAAVAWARLTVLLAFDILGRTRGPSKNAEAPARSEDLTPRLNARGRRELLCLSLPLGIVVLLGYLNSGLPNFFIKNALGERDVGIFAVIVFVISAGNMTVAWLGQSIRMRLARTYASGNTAAFCWFLGKLLAFGAVLAACGMVLFKVMGREILTVLFRPEYAERADLLPWVMAAGGILFMAQVLGFGMTAASFYNSQVALNAAAGLSLFLACFWLVPRQGLFGAILAMLIAAIVQFTGSVFVLAKGILTEAKARSEWTGTSMTTAV